MCAPWLGWESTAWMDGIPTGFICIVLFYFVLDLFCCVLVCFGWVGSALLDGGEEREREEEKEGKGKGDDACVWRRGGAEVV